MLNSDLLLSDNWQLCAVKYNEYDVDEWLRTNIAEGSQQIPEGMTFDEFAEAIIEDEENIEYFMVPANMDHDNEDKFITLCEEYDLGERTYFLETPEDRHFGWYAVKWVVYSEEDGWKELDYKDKSMIAIPPQD